MKFLDFKEHSQIFDIRDLSHSFVDEGTSLLGHFASLIGDISEGGYCHHFQGQVVREDCLKQSTWCNMTKCLNFLFSSCQCTQKLSLALF